MSISRRQFIAGSAAASVGLILPNIAGQVLRHFERTGEPLLNVTRPTNVLFHALPVEDEGYLLIDTSTIDKSTGFSLDPPPTTWRQFFEFEGVTLEEGMEGWEVDPENLDEKAEEEFVWWQWSASRNPTAQAFTKLQEYETLLGPELVGDSGQLGHLAFNEGQCPGSNDRWTEVSGPVGLSCLQHRLNALNTGIRIAIAPKNFY